MEALSRTSSNLVDSALKLWKSFPLSSSSSSLLLSTKGPAANNYTAVLMNLCTVIGGMYVSRFICNVIAFAKSNMIDGPLDFETRYGSKSWIIITGATGSIGYAFCEEFAARNFNLILIGRNALKLETITKELETNYDGIEIRAIVSDFSAAADKGWIDDIMNQIEDLVEDANIGDGSFFKVAHNISGLVNVAGMENITIPYTEASLESIRKVLIVNDFPVVLLTSTIMPLIKERYERTRCRGAVITVAAEAGKMIFPGLTIYAATKALANNFTIAAGVEYDKFGVDTLSLNPLGVSSNMVPEEPDGLVTITAKQCAQAGMTQLGRQRETNGWWFHSIQHNIFALMPNELFYYIFPIIVKNKMLKILNSEK